MRVIANIQDPLQVRRILEHLGERTGAIPTRAWDPLPCTEADLSAGDCNERHPSGSPQDTRCGRVDPAGGRNGPLAHRNDPNQSPWHRATESEGRRCRPMPGKIGLACPSLFKG